MKLYIGTKNCHTIMNFKNYETETFCCISTEKEEVIEWITAQLKNDAELFMDDFLVFEVNADEALVPTIDLVKQ